MAQEKGHLTTEQLSTLLDREVSAEERARWGAHLSTCLHCQQELSVLRQTVVLLHALPQPMLPRSFVLPLEATEAAVISQEAAEAVAIPHAVAPTPIRRTQRRTMHPYVRGVLRTMSALAAVIGVVFFLSGVLPSLVMYGASGTNTSTASGSVGNVPAVKSPPSVPTLSPHSVINGSATPGVQATQRDTPTSTVAPAATQVVKPQPSGGQQTFGSVHHAAPSSWPTFFIFNLSDPAGRVGLGMILVILGVMGFVLFRRSHRRTSL